MVNGGDKASGRRLPLLGMLVAGLAPHTLHLAPAALHQLDGRQEGLLDPGDIHFRVRCGLVTGVAHGLGLLWGIETLTPQSANGSAELGSIASRGRTRAWRSPGRRRSRRCR